MNGLTLEKRLWKFSNDEAVAHQRCLWMKNFERYAIGIWGQCCFNTSLKEHLSASFELNGVSTLQGSLRVLAKSLITSLAWRNTPVISEKASHLIVASGEKEVQKICEAKIVDRSRTEVALGKRIGLVRSSFTGRASLWDVVGMMIFILAILLLGVLTRQLSCRSAIWRFPTSLMEAQNIVRISQANGLPVLLGNLDHLNSSWILRALGKESMGIASPPFLHINCENLRIPNIVLQEKWQEEEIKLSNSIEIGGEIYFWENAMTSLEGLSPSAHFEGRKRKIFVLSSGYWLRRELNHGNGSRISELASIEYQLMNMVRDSGAGVEILAHPREFKYPDEMRAFYPSDVLPIRSLNEIGAAEYVGASFVGCQSTAFNSCLRLKDQGCVHEVLMVVPKSWEKWSLNELSIGTSIVTIDKVSSRLNKMC